MGMGRTRRLVSVELPLALPAIVASLRIATVTTIGLVTVTGLIGQGGYGSFIDEGLKRSFSTEVVVGGGLSVLMAIVLDLALVGFERGVSPWNRVKAPRT
jgi:osmoprotectant transport system permease protein